MSTLTVYVGKASDLVAVETIEGQPNVIASRKIVARIIARAEAVARQAEATPLLRVLVADQTGRVLAGYYADNLEWTTV